MPASYPYTCKSECLAKESLIPSAIYSQQAHYNPSITQTNIPASTYCYAHTR